MTDSLEGGVGADDMPMSKDASSICTDAGTRPCSDCPFEIGADEDCRAALIALEVAPGTLTTGFTDFTTNYTLRLPAYATNVTLKAIAPEGAHIEIQGEAVTSATPWLSPDLAIGENRLQLTVSATGAEATTYALLVNRQDTRTFLKASNVGEGDQFGSSVAISADGTTLAVGAPMEASGLADDEADNTAPSAGAVYVFTREDARWTQVAYLKAPSPGEGHFFGTEVYVFTRQDGAWNQQAFIKASNPNTTDHFGGTVRVAGDGNLLAVAAIYEDGNGLDIASNETTNSGAVYLFERVAGAWTQRAYVKATDPEADDRFGATLALSDDGSTLAVTASNKDVPDAASGSKVPRAGAVYLFSNGDAGWSQTVRLAATTPGEDDKFGSNLALSASGATLVVAARSEDSDVAGANSDGNENLRNSGMVYAFGRGQGLWTNQGRLKASNAGVDDYAGGLALSADGSMLAVGSAEEDSGDGNPNDNSAEDSGAVYVYQ